MPLETIVSTRTLFVWAYIFCGFAVAIGVAFEKERRDWGWKLLVWALVIEALVAVVIHQADTAIGEHQRSEIVKLQNRLLPRILTASNILRISEAIAESPSGVKFEFSATTEEAVSVAQALASIFEKAGWEWIDWRAKPHEITTWLPANHHTVGWILLSGIQISFSNPDLFTPGAKLIGALKAEFEGVRRDAKEGPVEKNNAPMVMRIMIGERPALYLGH